MDWSTTTEDTEDPTPMNSMHPGPATRVRLLALLPLVPAACEPAPESSHTARYDSAGIPITTALAALWGPGEGWTIRDEPLVEIGAVPGPEEYLLNDVTGAVRMSDGGIVLGEWTSGELRRYDREGTFVWRAGGRGEGPGEHQWLTFLGRLPGDSVVTWDIALGRVQVFGPDGRVAHGKRIESPWSDLTPRGVIGVSDRHLVLTFSDYRESPTGVARWPGVRIATWSHDDGDRAGADVRPRGRATRHAWRRADHANRLRVREGSPVVGHARAPRDRGHGVLLHPIGLARRRGHHGDSPAGTCPSGRSRASMWKPLWNGWPTGNVVYGGYSEEQAEASRPGWRKRPMASTLPVLESILLDAAGNLWVEPYTVYGAAVPPPEVYAPDGTWLGAVALPSGRGGLLANGGLEIGDDYVLGVWRGEQGVEYVRMYALDKPE